VTENGETIFSFRAVPDAIRGIRRAAKSRALVLGVVAVGLACGITVACCVASGQYVCWESDEEAAQWAVISEVDPANLATAGRNAYFNLEPGYRLRYTDGSATRTVTVRRKTKLIDGVETRLVEEQEEKDGQRTRLVWRYYAIDKITSAVYCFGAHTKRYDHGERIDRRGWRSGLDGAVFAQVMPAAAKTGDTIVRGHARRVYEVIDTEAEAVTPAGTFTNCLRLRAKETDGQGATEKLFAPGVGLVKDGQFSLAKIVQTVPRNAVPANGD
jgi:hypothetical protein